MGRRYGQRFALKGLGAIPVINGFFFYVLPPFCSTIRISPLSAGLEP